MEKELQQYKADQSTPYDDTADDATLKHRSHRSITSSPTPPSQQDSALARELDRVTGKLTVA